MMDQISRRILWEQPGLQVWEVTIEDNEAVLLDAANSLFDKTDLDRVGSYCSSQARKNFIGTRIALRQVAAQIMAVDPASFTIYRSQCSNCNGRHGRPEFSKPGEPHFSLSHSENGALIAFSESAIGVDIQKMQPLDRFREARKRLHPDERRELDAVAPQSQSAAFAQLWTRKESYLKAIGSGLCRSAAQDYVGYRFLNDPDSWSIHDLAVGDNYRAAVTFARSLKY